MIHSCAPLARHSTVRMRLHSVMGSKHNFLIGSWRPGGGGRHRGDPGNVSSVTPTPISKNKRRPEPN